MSSLVPSAPGSGSVPPGAGAPAAPPPTAGATLLANIQAAGAFATAMATHVVVGPGADNTPRTMNAWQVLAGEITKMVVDQTTGQLDQGKAGELSEVFSGIDKYCDNLFYYGSYDDGDEEALPADPLAQYLLGASVDTPGALPGIELFAKQATQVLGAIANDATTNISANGFFTAGLPVDQPIVAAGHGAASAPAPAPVQTSTLLQGTTGSPNLDAANLNSAILKTLLTPHRQAGMESCAIDSTVISETINNPARMAGMYKSLLESGRAQTPAMITAGTNFDLTQFTPFLGNTFAGNTVNFQMTNLDSMLVHSLACMLYESNDVSTEPAAYREAGTMPTKYLGADPNGAFSVNDGKVMPAPPAPPAPVSALNIKNLASGRPYVPSHFKLAEFNHGQNFLGSAAATLEDGTDSVINTIFADTNWIDSSSGCPIYWEIDTEEATYQAFTVETTATGLVQKHLIDGSAIPLDSGQILMMPKA